MEDPLQMWGGDAVNDPIVRVKAANNATLKFWSVVSCQLIELMLVHSIQSP